MCIYINLSRLKNWMKHPIAGCRPRNVLTCVLSSQGSMQQAGLGLTSMWQDQAEEDEG